MSFYINKMKKPTPPSPQPDSQFGFQTSPASQPMPTPASEDQIKEARNMVKASNMPTAMWKMFVLEIIDEHPEISKFIKDYLGS